ncbi:MAG: hypothetical protein LBT60_06620 [Oscillospiraceae bacterium]|jgi:hypothetical protein|nr:hypothetical protein [Oscillospiraceae bacterium]
MRDFSELFPEVYQVIPAGDHGVYAYMNDGAARLMDMAPRRDHGDCVDIEPFALLDCPIVDDPLEKTLL